VTVAADTGPTCRGATWVGRGALLLAVLSLASPALCLDPGRALTQFIHETWTARQGAPVGTIYSITRGPEGYLWLATASEGLVRFDGVEFQREAALDQVFGKTDYSAFSVFMASDGTLWVGTHWGLARRRNGHWEGPLEREPVGAIHETPSGRLTFVLGTRGLGWLDGDRIRTRDLGGLCVAGASDAEGNTWIACHPGLWKVRGDEVRRFGTAQGLSHDLVSGVALARDGGVWVGTRRGVDLFRKGRVVRRLSTRDGLASNDVSALYEDRHGILWVGTASAGLSRVRGSRVETYSEDWGLPSNHVTCFHEDDEGSLWIGTQGGLARFRAGNFIPLGPREGLPHEKVSSIIAARDGAVWIWTDGGGLTRIKNGEMTTLTTRDGLATAFGGPLFESRDGSIWVGHDRGISRVHDGHVTVFRQGALAASYTSAFFEDDQSVVAYVIGAGLQRIRLQGLEPYRLPDGRVPTFSMVWMAHRALDGSLWLATSSGAARIRGSRVDYVWATGDSNSECLAIKEDPSGVMWLSTRRGLVRVDGEHLTTYSTASGLQQERIHYILDDHHGGFWMSGPRGIMLVEREELEEYAAGRRQRISSRLFSTPDGLRSPQAISDAEPAGCRSNDGRLWFATITGVAIVDPQRLQRNDVPPPVHVEQIVDSFGAHAAREGMKLPPGSGERIEIRYAGLSLLDPDRMQFRYRLLGVDERWVDVGARRSAYYTRLGPGHYTFKVTACNNDGVWASAPATMIFEIAPQWWQRRWVQFLALGLFVAALAGSVRVRFLRLQARERELQRRVDERTIDLKTEVAQHRVTEDKLAQAVRRVEDARRAQSRFFTDISHELRTPLTLVLAPVESLLATDMPETVRATLEGVRRNALRLLRAMDELLELARLEAGRLRLSVGPVDLRALAMSVWESARPLARAREIDLALDASEPTTGIYGDAYRLDSVVTNLVGNALKFTPAHGRVVVSVAEDESSAWIEVEDSGPGITDVDLPRIFDRFYQSETRGRVRAGGVGIGLALAHELTQLHGGQLSVRSSTSTGTIFRMKLPKGDVHFRPHSVERRGTFTWPTASERRFDDILHLGQSEGETSLDADIVSAATDVRLEGGRRPCVLVVEDRDEMRSYLRQLLSETYDVAEAATAEDALAWLSQNHPDLVLSDVMLPGLSGADLCRKVKSDSSQRGIAVVLLTARAGSEATLDAYAHGADDFVAKPFHPQVLLARVNAQLRLRSLALQLVAREKLAALGTLAAGVAHEVRNPLNALLSAARILREDRPGSTSREEMLAVLVDAARRIEGIVSALDSHVRPEDMGGSAPTSVAEGVEATLVLMHHRMEGITVDREYTTERYTTAPAPIVNQVILNLIDNALRSGARHLRLQLREENEHLVLSVADDGAGVPAAIAGRIFDPFFTTRQPGDGTGLGLFLSRRMLRDHGGDIALVATGEHGATFEMSVPVAGAETQRKGVS
jgi:signal transduction histidine kinase/ligand-binding sensor domain-containing protein